jgi:2-polyprenyl-3-methyl-5-hydroxy-6-metoxy-1,4-benzoquinol methylase
VTDLITDREHCLICRGDGTAWIVAGNRELRRCRRCRFAWIVQGVKLAPNGRSIYEDASPALFNDQQADYYLDESAVEAARAKRDWVAESVQPGARLLDIGANLGLFVREAAVRFRASGIEPSANVVAWARREVGANLEVGSIDDELDRFHGQMDVVTLFDVLEHLPDPDRALRQCHRLLRPGGHLFLTTPDAGSVMSRVLGRHWYYVDMDEHVALFTRANVRTVLERTGFEVLAARTIGRSYRFSYIRRRLQFLGSRTPLLRAAYGTTWPLRFWPSARVTLDLGDVMGLVARRR